VVRPSTNPRNEQMNTPCPLGSIEWPQRPPYLIRERVFWLLRSIYATASLLKFARAKTSRPVLNAGSQWKEGLEGEDGNAVTSPVLIGRGDRRGAFAYANDR
jgi:hypothetical protein